MGHQVVAIGLFCFMMLFKEKRNPHFILEGNFFFSLISTSQNVVKICFLMSCSVPKFCFKGREAAIMWWYIAVVIRGVLGGLL